MRIKWNGESIYGPDETDPDTEVTVWYRDGTKATGTVLDFDWEYYGAEDDDLEEDIIEYEVIEDD